MGERFFWEYMVSIAIVGIGRWGKNLVREFNTIANVSKCCGTGNINNIEWLKNNYPFLEYTENYDEILKDSSIDGVAIATPIDTHYSLVKRALESGKHVFVEKPLTKDYAQAIEISNIANKFGLKISVGHILLYHPLFNKIEGLAKTNPLEEIIFNFNKYGTFDEDIVWNLASHDIAIAYKLFGMPIKSGVFYEEGFVTNCDIISFYMDLEKGKKCIFNYNRISPIRNKTIIIKTKESDYIWSDNKLSIFKENKIIDIASNIIEPLNLECKDFIDSIQYNTTPKSDLDLSCNVVKIISNFQEERKR